MNDANEVERLRARVAELEAQLSTAGEPAAAVETEHRRSVWWSVSSAVLMTLA